MVTSMAVTPITEAQLAKDIDHIYCCKTDGSRSFCGVDITTSPETTAPADCVVCLDICEEAGAFVCPLDGTDCPYEPAQPGEPAP